MTETAAVYMCPQCSSTLLDMHEGLLVAGSDGMVRCNACSWQGTENELLASAFQHNMGSHTDLTQALINDLRRVLSLTFAESFGAFLIKWGFVASPVTPLMLGRYVAAIAKAVLAAVIKERALIERERTNVS